MLQQLFDGVPELASAAALVSPDEIANLELWLKADAGTYEDAGKATPATDDGDAVYTWEDQSGNGLDMQQATAGERPTLKLAIQNGLAVLRADGGDEMKRTTGLPTISNDACTVFVAGNNTGGADGSAFDTDFDKFEFRIRTSEEQLVFRGNGAGSGTSYVTSGNGVSGSFVLLACRMNGTAVDQWVNGGSDQQAGTETKTANFDTTQWSLFRRQGAGNPLTGDIGEIIVYSAALSDADVANIFAYLSDRWGVTVT